MEKIGSPRKFLGICEGWLFGCLCGRKSFPVGEAFLHWGGLFYFTWLPSRLYFLPSLMMSTCPFSITFVGGGSDVVDACRRGNHIFSYSGKSAAVGKIDESCEVGAFSEHDALSVVVE